MLKTTNKRIAVLLIICLAFTALFPSFALAKSTSAEKAVENDVQAVENDVKPKTTPDKNVVEPANPAVYNWISQLLTRLQPWMQRVGVQLQVAYHVGEQAIARNISVYNAAKVVMYGKKAIDTQTGARVLYHSDLRIAIIVDQYVPRLVTIYDNAAFKDGRWVYRNWSW